MATETRSSSLFMGRLVHLVLLFVFLPAVYSQSQPWIGDLSVYEIASFKNPVQVKQLVKTQLDHFSVHPETGDVYVGAANYIYRGQRRQQGEDTVEDQTNRQLQGCEKLFSTDLTEPLWGEFTLTNIRKQLKQRRHKPTSVTKYGEEDRKMPNCSFSLKNVPSEIKFSFSLHSVKDELFQSAPPTS